MEQPTGLRLDVTERIPLSDTQADVAQLEQATLVPELRLTREETHDELLLSGQLLFHGTYRVMGVQGHTETLQHAIPVHIHLPTQRILDEEAIGVVVEQLDVTVVSARTLEVSSVLLLEGIAGTAVADHFHPTVQQEEPISPLSEPTGVADTTTPNPFVRPEDSTPVFKEQYFSFDTQMSADHVAHVETNREQAVDAVSTFTEKPSTPVSEHEFENITASIQTPVHDESQSVAVNTAAVPHASEQAVETGKNADPFAHAPTVALDASLHSHTNTPHPTTTSQPISEGIAWQDVFVGSTTTATSFRTVRMVIVQKDDVLQDIATRYAVSVSQLLTYNQMQTAHIEEGQVIAIPV